MLPTVCITGANSTQGLAPQTFHGLVSNVAQGFQGLFPASRNEVNQELHVKQLEIEMLAQRVNQLTPVRHNASSLHNPAGGQLARPSSLPAMPVIKT